MDARMTTVETSLNDLRYKLEQQFVAVDDKIEYVQKKLDVKLEQQTQQLQGRISAIDDRLQRMEDILLSLGQRFGVADETAHRLEVVRQSTWPEPAIRNYNTYAQVSRRRQSEESEFSAWVRELRRTSSPTHTADDGL